MSIPLKVYLSIFIVSVLTACSTMNDQFSCPMKPGVSCQSLDAVNAKIDRGEIGLFPKNDPRNQNLIPQPILQYSTGSTLTNIKEEKFTRSPEKILRVWIAPYEDSHGNYHEASQILTIIQPSHWQFRPVLSIP